MGVKKKDNIITVVSKKEIGKNKSGEYYLLHYNFPSLKNEVKLIRVNKDIYSASSVNSKICFQLYEGFSGIEFIDNINICQ